MREHGVQTIDTVKIDDRRPWRDDIPKALEINCRKSPHFPSAYALVDGLLSFESDNLADFNVNAIRTLAQQLDCKALVRQSELSPIEEAATERLIAICRALDADTYLCGGGAGGYQEDQAFGAASPQLMY